VFVFSCSELVFPEIPLSVESDTLNAHVDHSPLSQAGKGRLVACADAGSVLEESLIAGDIRADVRDMDPLPHNFDRKVDLSQPHAQGVSVPVHHRPTDVAGWAVVG
jgi:hypothetical protein